uniref:Uncharacterized protein n=1 Tax=Plectus sambesii TaxID=2011161 RepID=A0A914UTH5_9BILA
MRSSIAGLTSSVYSNDRPHATTLLMVMIMGAAVLLGGLLCCVRARAYYDHSLEAAVTRARLATEPQSQTLILVASHSSDQPHRHTVFDGRNCAFPSNACPPIFQFRGPIGLPTYEEAIVATTAQEWKGGDLAPPSYSESLPEPSQLDASATTTEAATTASVTVDVDSPVSPSTPEDELPHPTPLVCNDNSSNP